MKGLLPNDIRERDDKSGSTIPTVLNRFLMDVNKFEKLIQESKKTAASKYIDFKKFHNWFDLMKNRGKDFVNPGGFYTYIKLMIFIKDNPELFNE